MPKKLDTSHDDREAGAAFRSTFATFETLLQTVEEDQDAISRGVEMNKKVLLANGFLLQ